MSKTYHIINYGCQMNESDSEHFAGQLADLGYRYAEDFHDADVVLINTCCVRESAEKKILGKIGELKAIKAANPKKVICIVTRKYRHNKSADFNKLFFPTSPYHSAKNSETYT